MAWSRWRAHTEKEAEKAMQAKLLHLQAMHGRDRMLGWVRRLMNAKVARQFEFWKNRCQQVIDREQIAAARLVRHAYHARKLRTTITHRVNLKRDRAAVRIQTAWRGIFPRAVLQDKRVQVQRRRAVGPIQRCWRGRLGRDRARARRAEIVDVLRTIRAAFIITSHYRGSQARQNVTHLRLQHASATTIQRHIRGRWGRDAGTAERTKVLEAALVSLREALAEAAREVAAGKIQTMFRHVLVQREVMVSRQSSIYNCGQVSHVLPVQHHLLTFSPFFDPLSHRVLAPHDRSACGIL